MSNDLAVVEMDQRMSSREIAELTGKHHRHVLADIRKLQEEGAIGEPSFRLATYTDSQGKSRPEYFLDFEGTMTLLTGYNAKLRAKVIRRWRELEQGAQKTPQTYIEALEALVEAEKAKQKLLEDKTELEVRLDEANERYSIKRMEKLNPGKKFLWGLLKRESYRLRRPVKKVFDQNYGEVNAYHISVWESLYFDTLNFE